MEKKKISKYRVKKLVNDDRLELGDILYGVDKYKGKYVNVINDIYIECFPMIIAKDDNYCELADENNFEDYYEFIGYSYDVDLFDKYENMLDALLLEDMIRSKKNLFPAVLDRKNYC